MKSAILWRSSGFHKCRSRREYTAPTIAMYRAVPDATTVLEKNLPQREFGAKRERVRPIATIRFVRMVKKLKYAMTAPISVIPFAREVAIANGNWSNSANHEANAVAAMRTRLDVFLAMSDIDILQNDQLHPFPVPRRA
jgi:hypothetical protein